MNATFKLGIFSTALVGVIAAIGASYSQTAAAQDQPPPSVTVGTTIDDSVITARVQAALLDATDVKVYDLKVTTRKGEVMLSGFADNPAQIQRALAITRGIQGVKKIDNKVGLKGSATTVGNKIDDGIITTKVKAALLGDASVKSLAIGVVTRKGEVQLSGFVNNQNQIDRAIEVTRSIEGVSSVDNAMSIKK